MAAGQDFRASDPYNRVVAFAAGPQSARSRETPDDVLVVVCAGLGERHGVRHRVEIPIIRACAGGGRSARRWAEAKLTGSEVQVGRPTAPSRGWRRGDHRASKSMTWPSGMKEPKERPV